MDPLKTSISSWVTLRNRPCSIRFSPVSGAETELVICDIAPNISGIDVADQASSMYLVELALDMARQVLKPKGVFVAKVFQGAGSDAYLKELRSSFEKLLIRKPAASRPRSREVYVVAKGFKGAAAART
jgi:23S rRNA (uridine2552-2'-O)-methyltransferase